MDRAAPPDEIRALYTRGRETWPDLALDLAAFAAYVQDRMVGQDPRTLNAGDLFLTCACVRQDPRALALLDERYINTLDAALARLDQSGATVEEIKQTLRTRFLTREHGRPPRIGDYSGAGDLRTVLRVAAIRLGISLLRKHKRESYPGDEALLQLPAREATPEFDVLKQKYRAEFDAAFRTAVRALAPRERNLLRHQVLDRLSIDRIGALYGVHRATAARWVARGREALIKNIRRELQAQLGVSRDELDSILGLIQSHLDISLSVFLSQSAT